MSGQATPELAQIELEIGGMTCASCAATVERKLNKLDGVEAAVNYATEKARVQAPLGIDPAVLIAEVEKTGYTATLPRQAPGATAAAGDESGETASITTPNRQMTVATTPEVSAAPMGMSFFRQRFAKTPGMSLFSAA